MKKFISLLGLLVFAVGICFADTDLKKKRQERRAGQVAVMDSIIQENNFRFELANGVGYSGYYRNPYIDVYPDRIYVKIYENTPADYAAYQVIKKNKTANLWSYNFTFTGSRNQDILVEMLIDPRTGKVDYRMQDRKVQRGAVSTRQGYVRPH